jgi:HEAT repeat protein
MRSANPVTKARVEEDLVDCVMKAFKTRDNLLWKPYAVVRTGLPAIDNLKPTWQEPKTVRYRAILWLLTRTERGSTNSVPPGLLQRAIPVLCDLALNDPAPEIRLVAKLTLSQVGTFSPEVFQIMLGALASTSFEEINAAAEWFCRYPVDPERVVRLLANGLTSPSARSDCASALRSYGPRASLAVERLKTLAKSNDWWVSWNAIQVLESIDPKVAKKAGVR